MRFAVDTQFEEKIIFKMGKTKRHDLQKDYFLFNVGMCQKHLLTILVFAISLYINNSRAQSLNRPLAYLLFTM